MDGAGRVRGAIARRRYSRPLHAEPRRDLSGVLNGPIYDSLECAKGIPLGALSRLREGPPKRDVRPWLEIKPDQLLPRQPYTTT